MPTTLHTFSAGQFGFEWQTRYVSEGINALIGRLNARGIMRGFRLAPASGTLRVQLEVDGEQGDSVAVYRNSVGNALVARATATVGPLDLAAYASQTIVIALIGAYATGSASSYLVRAFTLAEWAVDAENPYGIILGQVAVPASGSIAVGDIAMTGRMYAMEGAAADTFGWIAMIANPSFEQYLDGSSYAAENKFDGWSGLVVGHTVASSSTSRTGARSLQLTATGAGTALFYPGFPDDVALTKFSYLGVSAGDEILAEVWVRPNSPVNVAMTLVIQTYDASGVSVATYNTAGPTSGATFQKVRFQMAIPSGVSYVLMSLKSVATSGPSGGFYLDDAQIYIRPQRVNAKRPRGFKSARFGSVLIGSLGLSREFAITINGSGTLMLVPQPGNATPAVAQIGIPGDANHLIDLELSRKLKLTWGVSKSTTPTAHEVSSSQMCKAWGTISAPSAPAFQVDDGFNIDSVTLVDASPFLSMVDIVFKRALKDEHYVVSASYAFPTTPATSKCLSPEVFNRTTTGFRLQFREADDTTAILIPDPTSSIMIMVFGRWASET